MKLHELKSLIKTHTGSDFRLHLPNGSAVPVSFHVTEVGAVHKTFIDCGGTMRRTETCQLQVWVGTDDDHRLDTNKAITILEKAQHFLPDEDIPVEIEYEDEVISQYTIEGHELGANAVTLKLAHKHTDCLAKERCGLPVPFQANQADQESSCCAGSGCC